MIEQWDTFFTRTDRFVCRGNGGDGNRVCYRAVN